MLDRFIVYVFEKKNHLLKWYFDTAPSTRVSVTTIDWGDKVGSFLTGQLHKKTKIIKELKLKTLTSSHFLSDWFEKIKRSILPS